jgi:hypothetical protein
MQLSANSSGKAESAGAALNLSVGELVTVRPAHEILATLDQESCVDRLPFMPQMLQYCGKEFRVRSRAHKMCDTVYASGGRQMAGAVFLDGIHCDGQAFGGCRLACSIIWKEAWLESASADRRGTAPERAREIGARGEVAQ